VVRADGSSVQAYVGMTINIGDVITTNGSTALAAHFDLGGRLAVRPGTSARINGERSASGSRASEDFYGIGSGLWDFSFGLFYYGQGVRPNAPGWLQCGNMKESIEIQTTGGVMGIKG
jgi:hypothetical protein